MDTDTLTPPPDMDAAFDQAIADHNSNAQGTPQNPSPQPKAEKSTPKPATQQKPREEAKKGSQKLEAKPSEKSKSPWDKLEQVKPVEEGQTEQAEQPAEQELPDNAPKDQQAWTHLKKSLKEANTQLAELKPLKEQFEKVRKEYETLRNTPPKLPEPVQKELEELRTLKAAYDVEDTPEWNQRITVPFQQREAFLNDFATKYGINAEQFMAATDEPNPIVRAEKMEEIMRTGTKEVSSSIAAMINQRVDELHLIYAEMNHMRQNAQQIWSAKQGKNAELTKAQEQEKQQKWQAAAEDVFGKLKDKLPDIFSDEEFANAVKDAKISDDPVIQAFQAMSAEILAKTVEENYALKAEIAKMKGNNEARAKAKPSMTPTDVVLPKDKGDVPETLEDAMRLQKSFDMRYQR